MQVKVFQTIEDLNRFAAEKFVEIGNRAIIDHGTFSVALAGGSTPKGLYRLLTTDEYRKRIPWRSVKFYFGDERNVAPGDEESNFRMASENLFEPLRIPDSNIDRWMTELIDIDEIVESYEDRLITGFSTAAGGQNPVNSYDRSAEEKWFPRFDLILLGMGGDGHTASLFPFTDALAEDEKIAAANWVEKLNAWRFTLTFPTINNAANVIFLVKGADKSETLKDVLEGEYRPEKLPSQRIDPSNGNLFWLVDEAAAGNIRFENHRRHSLPETE